MLYDVTQKSQLRRDPVSGDWVVIAPLRSKRPEDIMKRQDIRLISAKETCPLENPQASGNEKAVLRYGDSNNWTLQVVPNKFPAFIHKEVCASVMHQGPYSIADAIGYQELLITRNHNQNFAELTPKNALDVFKAFQERYHYFLKDSCTIYVALFHNWGPKAGASLYHPHYQIIAIPIIPPDVRHSLEGSSSYFTQHQFCVHCTMLDFEIKHKQRIIFENEHAVALAPFVSRSPFEIRIFPKQHMSYFEDTNTIILENIVEALQISIKKISRSLHDPDFNFFIHTAPAKDKANYSYYHWHIEILPKLNISAGFELSTGVDINPIDPDDVSMLLK